MKPFELTFEDINPIICSLADKIKKYKPTMIAGIARGGLTPAVMLSHYLNIPMESILWQTRDGGTKEDNEVVAAAIGAGVPVVFIDDINDSGTTMTQIKDHYGNGIFVCLVEKKQSEFTCDHAGMITDTDRWINFPWELKADE
jgi:hypoxanthine phosphoribosyltransferase